MYFNICEYQLHQRVAIGHIASISVKTSIVEC